MFELSKNDYGRLHDAVMKAPFNMLMARSVILDHTDGRIFVDSRETPQSFYIIHSYGMTYLCGDSSNELFNSELYNYFTGNSYPREKDEWIQAFPRDWDIVMNRFIDKQIAIPYSRLNFMFEAKRFYENYGQVDKSQYEVIPTPKNMLFEISGSVVPKDYWKTPEQFVGMAQAYSIMIDGKPVSTAFTSARHDDKLEIGIETVKAYHGKGLAYLVCAKLIEYCLCNNLEPIWSCRLENTGSVNLAKKLGFVETLRMPYYHMPKSNNRPT